MRPAILLALAAVCLALTAAPCPAGQSEMDARREIRLHLGALLDQSRAAAEKCGRLQDELDAARLREAKERSYLEFLAEQRNTDSQAVEELARQLAGAEQRLARGREAYKDRLRALYLQGMDLSWHWLASAETYDEALERVRNLELVVRSDQKRLAGLEQRAVDLAALRAEYEQRRQRQEHTAAELALGLERLRRHQAESRALLTETEHQREVLARSIDSVRAAEGRLVRTFALDKRYDPDLAPPAVGGQPAASPVDGDMSGGGNGGVNFMARKGAQVRAPWAGNVIFASAVGGWGQVVVLDHGDRVHTVLANLGSLAVEQGQSVRAGDVVGSVGPGGRLFLQVRKNAVPVDSADWLRLHP